MKSTRTLLACGLLALGIAAVAALYVASQHVPAFYRDALAADPADLKKGSQRLVEKAATLHNHLWRTPQWQVVFAAAEINGWLAVAVPREHAELLPAGFHDPRVRIESDGITFACHGQWHGLHGVISLKVDLYMDAPNVVTLRIRRARLGAIPWPLDGVLRSVAQAARRSELHVQWRQAGGDPVMRITLPPIASRRGHAAEIDGIRLEPGAIAISGKRGDP